MIITPKSCGSWWCWLSSRTSGLCPWLKQVPSSAFVHPRLTAGQEEQTVEYVNRKRKWMVKSRLEWCVECCIFHVWGVRVPDWSGNSWASAPDGWHTSLAPDSDSGGPVVLLAHRGLRWWHHGRSTLVPLGHRELFGAVERKRGEKSKLKHYNRHCTFMWRRSHGDGRYKLRPGTRSMLCQRDWWGWWWSWLWVGELQLSEQPPQSQSSWHSSRNSSPNWCWRAGGSTPYTWHTANTNTLHKLLLLIWSHLNL